MKSIKEKSFELFPEMLTDSDDWDVIEAQCDRDEQRRVFVKGANYVLDEIKKLVNFNRWAAQDLYKLIEQLKK